MLISILLLLQSSQVFAQTSSAISKELLESPTRKKPNKKIMLKTLGTCQGTDYTSQSELEGCRKNEDASKIPAPPQVPKSH